ncbi:MAG: hypothetical protein HY293_03475, partial [Planctomycetes bacterium]|nr:hypothetical protein [Planctomycetota bacterium]
TDVKLVAPAGLDIGKLWQVRFKADGFPGGSVGGKALVESVKSEGQYR